jgi:hypothetical protein
MFPPKHGKTKSSIKRVASTEQATSSQKLSVLPEQ